MEAVTTEAAPAPVKRRLIRKTPAPLIAVETPKIEVVTKADASTMTDPVEIVTISKQEPFNYSPPGFPPTYYTSEYSPGSPSYSPSSPRYRSGSPTYGPDSPTLKYPMPDEYSLPKLYAYSNNFAPPKPPVDIFAPPKPVEEYVKPSESHRDYTKPSATSRDYNKYPVFDLFSPQPLVSDTLPRETSREDRRGHTKPRDTSRDYTRPSEDRRDYTKPRDTSRDYTKPREDRRDYTKPRDTSRDYTRPSEDRRDYTKPRDTGREYTRRSEERREFTRPSEVSRDSEYHAVASENAVSSERRKTTTSKGKLDAELEAYSGKKQ
jgi:hypothetical protein